MYKHYLQKLKTKKMKHATVIKEAMLHGGVDTSRSKNHARK